MKISKKEPLVNNDDQGYTYLGCLYIWAQGPTSCVKSASHTQYPLGGQGKKVQAQEFFSLSALQLRGSQIAQGGGKMGVGGPCFRKVIDSLCFICFCLLLCNYKQVLQLQYAMFSSESSQESLSVLYRFTQSSQMSSCQT